MVHRVLEDKMGGRSVEVIGPAPLPLYRLRGHYRWHLMLRGEAPDELHSVLEHALEGVRLKKGVFLAIDVDPVAIL